MCRQVEQRAVAQCDRFEQTKTDVKRRVVDLQAALGERRPSTVEPAVTARIGNSQRASSGSKPGAEVSARALWLDSSRPWMYCSAVSAILQRDEPRRAAWIQSRDQLR